MAKDKSSNKVEQLSKEAAETLTALLTHNTRTQAAKSLGIGRTTLYDRINRHNLDKYIESIPRHALQTLQQGSIKAAEVYVDALEEDENKMEAAGEVLDRVGVTKNKQDTPTVNVQVNNLVKQQREKYNLDE